VERWALPTIEKARDNQTTSITSIPRSCFEDASCEICSDLQIKKEQVDPTTDMYQCRRLKRISRNVKDSHMRALPNQILGALQAWAMVAMDRSASDASYGSSFEEVWSKRKRDMVLDPT